MLLFFGYGFKRGYKQLNGIQFVESCSLEKPPISGATSTLEPSTSCETAISNETRPNLNDDGSFEAGQATSASQTTATTQRIHSLNFDQFDGHTQILRKSYGHRLNFCGSRTTPPSVSQKYAIFSYHKNNSINLALFCRNLDCWTWKSMVNCVHSALLTLVNGFIK
jgi:hypothetical protein